jgi:NADH-quinone oxidoreductase subunit A
VNDLAYLVPYYPIFLYLIAIVGFVIANLFLTHLVGPNRKTPVKMMPYESGMDPIGDARQRFDVKFYLIAILFLVFDVELLFLYPWAVVAYRPLTPPSPPGGEGMRGAFLPEEIRVLVFWEVIVFLGTLVVAYVYAWRRGVFQWR